MSRQVEFDRNANAFADRYVAFLSGMKSAYQARVLNRNINYKSIKSFEQEVNNLAIIYLEREIEEVKRAETTVIEYITSDFSKYGKQVEILDKEEFMDYINDYTSYVYNSIKQQVTKDILFATQKLRVESLKLLSKNYDYFKLIMNYKEPEFVFNDSAGRNLPSKKYIRTMVRDYFVKTYNDMFMEQLSFSGETEAEVSHIDQTHKHNGLILSINDNENELDYFNVRDDVFHPNSNAVLKMVGA